MNPEFSRAAVATLIAAIIGSVLDSAADVPDAPHTPPPPPDEVPLDVPEVFDRLRGHLDYRVEQLEQKGVPPRLSAELRDIQWMLRETLRHQGQFGPTSDRPN